MTLYIDTALRDKIIIGINEKQFETGAKKNSSQELLPFIKKILESEKLNIKDITEIKINVGPGSFTGLRIGIAVANALGFALNIPVNGKKIEDVIKYS